MLIQITTDKNIEGTEATHAHYSGIINDELERFDEHITRVIAHLSDENAGKTAGDDQRCVMEASMKGTGPVVVTVVGPTMHQSVKAAAEKVAALLEKTMEKRRVQS